jgi:excisionase family DNA binding protein
MTAILSRDIEPFVDANRAAEFLSVTRRRVLEMARAGQIPAYPVGDRSRRMWRFRLSELAEAIAKKPATGGRPRGIIYPGGPLAVPKGKGH